MVEMRYNMRYLYVFEGRHPGEVGVTMPAYEVEVAPGKWELVAPFNPEPTNPILSMGRRWLASVDDPTTAITSEKPMTTLADLDGRAKRAEQALLAIKEMEAGVGDEKTALAQAVQVAKDTLEAAK